MSDFTPIEFVNGLGEKKYQPRMPTGEVLVWSYIYDDKEWLKGTHNKPYLTSYKKAIRIAKREYWEEQKDNWKETDS